MMFQDKESQITRGQSSDYDIKAIAEEISKLTDIITKLPTATLDAFANFERMASAARRLFGGTEMFSTTLKNTFADARTSVIDLGGDMKDIEDIQFAIFEKLGTQTLLNSEQFSKLYSNANLVSKTGANIGAEAGEIAVKFVNVGVQLNNVGNTMEGILNRAREIGVSTVATFSILQQNLQVANTFAFKNGVDGMAEMAANAALMRVDMGKTLATAEKFLDPEKAIEAATRFQNLGVNVAELLDPRKLEYMSLFEPDKLREKIGEAMKQYVKVDELGNMSVSPAGLLAMREFQKIVAFTKEDLVGMANSTYDIDKKIGQMRFNPNLMGDEKMQKAIAGMATMADKGEFKGQYIITIEDKDKKKVIKPITKLSDKDVEILREATKAKTAEELQKQTNGEIKNSVLLLRSIDKTLATYLALQQKVQDTILGTLRTSRGMAEKQLEDFGIKRTKSGALSTKGIKEKITDYTDAVVDKLKPTTVGLEKTMGMINEAYNSINRKKSQDSTQSTPTLPRPTDSTQSTPTLPRPTDSTQSTPTPPNPTTYNTKSIPQPIDTGYVKNQSPLDTLKKREVQNTIDTNSKIEFGGTININVSPSEFKDSVLHALDSPDVKSKIASAINIQQKQENIYRGSGNVSKTPSLNFGFK